MKKGKLLSITDIACFNLLLLHGTKITSGFTPGVSAINQLLSLANEFGKALDEGKDIRVVFL